MRFVRERLLRKIRDVETFNSLLMRFS